MRDLLNRIRIGLYTRKCRRPVAHASQGFHTAHLTWLGRRHYLERPSDGNR